MGRYFPEGFFDGDIFPDICDMVEMHKRIYKDLHKKTQKK